MSVAKFRARGRFVMATVDTDAEVVIDRGTNLFTVRPLRSKRLYALPLSTVAEMVVWKLTKLEIASAKRKSKAEKKILKTSK